MAAPETDAPAREDFFAALPEIADFARVADRGLYEDAPESWWLLLTDVRGSTCAIEAGRYRDVNALGVASIAALRNAAPDLELPYVFGGDGATLLAPGSRLDACTSALRGVQRLAREAFDLELRAAALPIAELVRDRHAVRVARFRLSPHVCLAMFAGDGFAVAEQWLKEPGTRSRYALDEQGPAEASFEGFECRWRPVQSRRGEIVSLLVLARDPNDAEKSETYSRLLAALAPGTGAEQHPIARKHLRLGGRGMDFSIEARIRSRAPSGSAFQAAVRWARKKSWIGRILIAFGASAGGFDGNSYPEELIANTDFRKFDETLRMVLDLTAPEIEALIALLEEERAAGHLVYGLHRAPAALVTCIVRSYSGDHVHFVDGANGGYALAAKQLKAQLGGAASVPPGTRRDRGHGEASY